MSLFGPRAVSAGPQVSPDQAEAIRRGMRQLELPAPEWARGLDDSVLLREFQRLLQDQDLQQALHHQ